MLPSEYSFSHEQLQRLNEFQDTLLLWNRKISLTSVPPEKIMSQLIFPSAWLGIEYSKANLGTVVDFGAGAGIPGIPMAICDENNKYILVDSSQKKIGFIKECIAREQIGVKGRVQARAERISRGKWEKRVDVVVTRGTGSILSIVDLWRDKVNKQGFIDVYKGEKADLEIEELMGKYPEAKCEKVVVPEWFDTLKLIRIKGVIL